MREGSWAVTVLTRRLSHHRMRLSVGAWIDGEVSGSDARRVRVHLDECWGCSGDAELLRMAKVALARLAEREPTALAAGRIRRWAGHLDAGPGL